MLAELPRDLAYAVRVLAKEPGFVLAAVASLAIGIGMCGVILLGSQGMAGPMRGAADPSALVTPRRLISYPYFERYRDLPQLAGRSAALLPAVPFAVAPSGDLKTRAERFYGHVVSPEYFTVLGVTPAAGRLFSPVTEKFGMSPVVVLSHRFWQRYWNADPRVIGRPIRVNNQLATVAGVAGDGFLGVWPWNPADIFLPLTCAAGVVPELSHDEWRQPELELFRYIVRLPPHTTAPQLEAALTAATLAFDREHPNPERDRDPGSRQIRLIPGGAMMLLMPEFRAFIYAFNFILWAIVVSVLCANLANLLLARGLRRRREMGIRLSLGASRGRLVRQLLTESVILSLGGGIAGLLASTAACELLSRRPIPARVPFEMFLQPDLRILLVTVAISVLTGIVFGLVPALTATRVEIVLALKGDSAPPSGTRRRRVGARQLFVAWQVASSLMLLLVTGYMVAGYQHTTRLDPGFVTSGLGVLSIDPIRDGYSPGRIRELLTDLPDEFERIPGVGAMALAGSVPFADLAPDKPNTRVSADTGNGAPRWSAIFREPIGARYFETLGVPILRGREFTRRDGLHGDLPAVINQTAAEDLFGATDPIGHTVRDDAGKAYRVIGIARDSRSGFMPPKPVATLFVPLTPDAGGATIVFRSSGGEAALRAVQNHLFSLHPDLTVFDAHTMDQNIERMNSFVQWSSGIYTVLGFFALLLACVGLGGVTAYSVARRRKEIGIRMALGAGAGHVRNLVLREGAVLAAAGCVLGFAATAAISRAASTVTEQIARVFQTRVDDPLLVFGAPTLLAALALLACYLPARRASTIDPAETLRE